MARKIMRHGSPGRLAYDEDQLAALESYLSIEIEDALSARKPLEATWRECLRQYEGVPKDPVKNFPIENAPNIEITLGAIAADAIYAQMIDLIFTASPLVTCQPETKGSEDKETVKNVQALQRFVNWMASNEVGLRDAVDEAALDNTQLGTCVWYVPWVEKLKKMRSTKVLDRHPQIYCMPPEDVIVPAGSRRDPEEMPWFALRFWPSLAEVEERARRNKWDVSNFAPVGAKDWVRNRRELLGKQVEGITRKGDIYEVLDVYVYYDIDGDGIREDLYVVFDRTSRSIAHVGYCPYDCRPASAAVYQRRAHLFYGIGVLQMIRPYQEELTDLHNWQVLNSLLANCRMWATKQGSVPDNLIIHPNKNVPCDNPKEDIVPLAMHDTFPSLPQLQMAVVQLAERRVGINELSQRPVGPMGTRTPGITALSYLQQMNKRFTPAFDGFRLGIVGALRQCLYRYQEELLKGRESTIAHFLEILGNEDGQRVINLLKDPRFDESVNVELTASSASINREADRQNAMLLVNILSQYYQQIFQLATILTSQQEVAPELRDIIMQISEGAREAIDRTIRTFDQVRDPVTFLIDLEPVVQGAMGELEAPQAQGLLQALQGGEPLELAERGVA